MPTLEFCELQQQLRRQSATLDELRGQLQTHTLELDRLRQQGDELKYQIQACKHQQSLDQASRDANPSQSEPPRQAIDPAKLAREFLEGHFHSKTGTTLSPSVVPPKAVAQVDATAVEQDTAGRRHGLAAFVAERCEIAPSLKVPRAVLYASYVTWCGAHYRKSVDPATFGRWLREIVPTLGDLQPRTPIGRTRVYKGMALR